MQRTVLGMIHGTTRGCTHFLPLHFCLPLHSRGKRNVCGFPVQGYVDGAGHAGCWLGSCVANPFGQQLARLACSMTNDCLCAARRSCKHTLHARRRPRCEHVCCDREVFPRGSSCGSRQDLLVLCACLQKCTAQHITDAFFDASIALRTASAAGVAGCCRNESQRRCA